MNFCISFAEVKISNMAELKPVLLGSLKKTPVPCGKLFTRMPAFESYCGWSISLAFTFSSAAAAFAASILLPSKSSYSTTFCFSSKVAVGVACSSGCSFGRLLRDLLESMAPPVFLLESFCDFCLTASSYSCLLSAYSTSFS